MIGILAALLLLPPFTAAHAIRFTPPNPTTHTSIDATAVGTWPDGCVPQPGGVDRAGSTITLHVVSSDGPCPAVITSYSTTFHLDLVPAGSYTVISFDDRGSKELARQTLIVRDAETLALKPYAVPITGGKYSVGGVVVDAPPHAAGTVDVVANGKTATAALIYYDPAEADPAVFEPVVFPSTFEGPGALGSQWTTENFIELGASMSSFFRDPVAGGRLANDSQPWGRVLYAMRDTIDDTTFASRIKDLSRQSQSAGTEVPVVRERDFRARTLRFLNIPSDDHSRLTLRVWSLDDAPLIFGVDGRAIPFPIPLIPMTKIPGTTLFFGSADITSRLRSGTQNAVVSTPFSSTPRPRIWGMISITNNDTQQVTILSPQ